MATFETDNSSVELGENNYIIDIDKIDEFGYETPIIGGMLFDPFDPDNESIIEVEFDIDWESFLQDGCSEDLWL